MLSLKDHILIIFNVQKINLFLFECMSLYITHIMKNVNSVSNKYFIIKKIYKSDVIYFICAFCPIILSVLVVASGTLDLATVL